LYAATPDGYCGDEDNGQTSAWYVFSALGFYPLCPGSNEYVLGSPLFKSATIKLSNGKEVSINAPNNSKQKRYVSEVTLNGNVYTKNFITHEDLMKGAKINFNMSASPVKTRGTQASDLPYSFTNESKSMAQAAEEVQEITEHSQSSKHIVVISRCLLFRASCQRGAESRTRVRTLVGKI